MEELERGKIGSHAPLPPDYLKALREAQLIRINNMHASSYAPNTFGKTQAHNDLKCTNVLQV